MSELAFVDVQGARLAYRAMGQGDVIVFVHGAFCDHRVWAPQLADLAADHRCIAPDLRYCGASWTEPVDRYNLATHASDLGELVRALSGGVPVNVVASSYGAAVALAWAASCPQACASLFLNEPALMSLVTRPDDVAVLQRARGELAPVVAALQAGDAARAVELFCDWTAFPGAFRTMAPDIQAIFLDNARTVAPALSAPPATVRPEDLASIRVPVTFTAGDRTTPYFSVQVDAAHRAIAHSRRVTIADAHHASPFEQPAAFNRALREHLRAASAAAG